MSTVAARSWFLALLLICSSVAGLAAGPAGVRAQSTAGTSLSCTVASAPSPARPTGGAPNVPAAPEPPADAVEMTVGYIPISIYAPVFVAADKGYYAEEGLDVELEPFAGGSDLATLTESGQLEAAATGAGPALWNAVALGLPLALVAAGHREGNPVATPLMISRDSCESGAIKSVADLLGKRVAVNAPGATEYWLAQALGTGGLTLDDVDLRTLAFPDAVLALESGALAAAMVAEPLATKAEQDGFAVRLATDFPVQAVQPTAIVANTDFIGENPDAVQGFVTAYLRACRDLAGEGFADPVNLEIIGRYAPVSPELIAAAVPPIYSLDGKIDPVALAPLQTFFRERGQLEYDEDIDPRSFIEPRFAEAALGELGPAASPAAGV